VRTARDEIAAVLDAKGLKLVGLVNNAGVSRHLIFEYEKLEEVMALYNVNVFGVYRVTQAFLPLLRESSAGRVVNVGSMAPTLPASGYSSYAGSKNALESISDVLRLDDLRMEKGTSVGLVWGSRALLSGKRLSHCFPFCFAHPSAMAGSSPKELESHAAADGALFRKLVADGYNQCADAYLSQHAVDDPDDMRLQAFRELFAEMPRRARILDAGCGAGVPVAKAVVEDPRDMSVTGVDISQRQIELAKKLVPSDRATFLCSDMASMDFEKESFDAICAFFSVFHLPRRDQAAFFVRVASWLRPGGRFVFNLGSGLEDGEGECLESDFLGAAMVWSSYPREQTLELLQKAGFALEKEELKTVRTGDEVDRAGLQLELARYNMSVSLLKPGMVHSALHGKISGGNAAWRRAEDVEGFRVPQPEQQVLFHSHIAMGSNVSQFEVEVGPGMKQVLGHKTYGSISESFEENGEAIAVMSRSFCGTATTAPEGTMDWVIGPSLKEKWDDPNRKSIFDWMMRMEWSLVAARGGFAVAGLKPDGSMGAVVLVAPYPDGVPSALSSHFEQVRAFWAGGFPPKSDAGEAFWAMKTRAFAGQDAFEEVKSKYCTGPHAHVKVVAVDPDAQGMGFCGKLMRFVNTWADSRHLPLWLETSGERNVAIYERFGYKTMERFDIKCETSELKEDIHHDEFGMLRSPP
ncbi:BDH1, partial [Symbiodinium necroappetens]